MTREEAVRAQVALEALVRAMDEREAVRTYAGTRRTECLARALASRRCEECERNALAALLPILPSLAPRRRVTPTPADRVTVLTSQVSTWAHTVEDMLREGGPDEDLRVAVEWVHHACEELKREVAALCGEGSK